MRAHLGGQDWFVALADHEAAAGAAAVMRAHAPQTVPHASGRPWLIGRWAADQLTLAEAGPVKVAVIGCCPVTATALSAAARWTRALGDLDRLAVRLSGSFHLVAAVGRQVRVQGSVSGLRRVFYTRVGPVTVAADRMDILAGLGGAAVDEQRLAVWMLSPWAPHPLADVCGWQGVHAVPDGSYLRIDPGGSDLLVRWWNPPEPVLPLAEAASVVREALCAAVEIRTRAGGVISADLSGGLDSTSLCFLAAHGASSVVVVTQIGLDPGHDDRRWAERAAAALGNAEHLVFDPDQLPPRYAGISSASDGQDGPFARVRNSTRDTQLARILAGRGCRLHVAGHGGDEVMQAPPSYLHTVMRTHPRVAVDHLRGHRALARWPLAAVLRQLCDHRTYGEWLAASADELAAPPPPPRTPSLGWGPALRIAPWATTQAIDAAMTLLRRAAATAEPLAASCGQHAALQAVRTGAHLIRHAAQVMARAGLPLAVPYFDDQVVEACLAVRLHERTTPWRYKPLIAEAMRDLVPATALARATKGEFSADVHAGLRGHRADLTELLDDLILARLGLVDADALRVACLGLRPPTLPLAALETTLGCEAWLRSLARHPPAL